VLVVTGLSDSAEDMRLDLVEDPSLEIGPGESPPVSVVGVLPASIEDSTVGDV